MIQHGGLAVGFTTTVLCYYWETHLVFELTCIVSDPLYAELVSLLCELRLLGLEWW